MSDIHVDRTEFVSGTYHFNPSKNPPERNKLYWQAHWKPHKTHQEPIKIPQRQTSVDSNTPETPPVHSPPTGSPFSSSLLNFSRQRTSSVNDETKIFT